MIRRSPSPGPTSSASATASSAVAPGDCRVSQSQKCIDIRNGTLPGSSLIGGMVRGAGVAEWRGAQPPGLPPLPRHQGRRHRQEDPGAFPAAPAFRQTLRLCPLSQARRARWLSLAQAVSDTPREVEGSAACRHTLPCISHSICKVNGFAISSTPCQVSSRKGFRPETLCQ